MRIPLYDLLIKDEIQAAWGSDKRSFTFTNILITIVFCMALAHGFHLLPQLCNFTIAFYNHLRHWLRGPDEPEPEKEDPTDPQLLDEPHDQGGDQPVLQGEPGELPADAADLPAGQIADEPDEPPLSLEDTVVNLENLVEHLRGQLRLANEDNLRHHAQLQALLEEHERLAEQHEGARRVAGDFYMDRQLVLHQADKQRQQQEEIQMAVNQRINQLLNRDVFFTPRGECWPLSEACARARSHCTVFGRRACRVCVRALQIQQQG